MSQQWIYESVSCFGCAMESMCNDVFADCVSCFFLHLQSSRFVDIFVLYVLAADSSSPPS